MSTYYESNKNVGSIYGSIDVVKPDHPAENKFKRQNLHKSSIDQSLTSETINDYGQTIHQSASDGININLIEEKPNELTHAHNNRYAVNKVVFERKESSNSSKSKTGNLNKRKSSIGSHLEVKVSFNRRPAKKLVTPSEEEGDMK